nr:unnamed protein product [Naegleria fowleri]
MNTSMEGGSDDGESTEYETDEEETIHDQGMTRSLVNRRQEDDDFGLPSDDEEGEEESDNLNSTGKFTSIGNSSSSSNKGIVVSNRYERGNSGTNRTSSGSTNQKPSSAQGKVVPNQHYDEVFETNEDEVHSIPSPEHTPRDPRLQIGASNPNAIPSSGIAVSTKSEPPNKRMQQESDEEEEEEEDEEEDVDEEEDEEEEEEDHYSSNITNARSQQPRSQHSSYNANESNLLLSKMNISNELKELFTYINRYKPHEIELDTKLKPFIPDYMASVGELDPFLKIKRPDLKEDELDDLGLKVIDEPNPIQSDPTVVTLDLTYQMKGDMTAANITSNTHSESVLLSGISMKKPETIIKSVESGNDKLIQKWINDIRELHKKKPPPTVQYSKVNVDFTQLIQAWPDAFEEELARTDLPGADLDVDLDEYIKIICSLLDIPVYEGHLIESLHVLFTLYLEFKTNQHIQSQMM